MKTTCIRTLMAIIIGLFCGAAQTWGQSGFDIIVHESVTASALDQGALKDILLGKTAYWEGGQAVTIALIADKSDAILQAAVGMTPSQFKTHWQRLVFSGRGKQPKELDTADKVVALVAETKGAMALVPAGTPAKGVKQLPFKP